MPPNSPWRNSIDLPMKYKCLVFDHDDTVVNSTATIHHPCFQKFLDIYYPGRTCSLDEYFAKNFDPGFLPMCRDEYGMTPADLDRETAFWRAYVKDRIPAAYEGLRTIMERHKASGGILAVISHSFKDNILRDYAANGLPTPDAVYGWELSEEKRKPSPWALYDIMERYSLAPDEILVIDDLKPGYDMASDAGVPFAAACWAYDIESIRSFMRAKSPLCFNSVAELDEYLT